MIAKAFILRDAQARKELPDTGRPAGWATLDSNAARPVARTGTPEALAKASRPP
jgi:hypothetical protein